MSDAESPRPQSREASRNGRRTVLAMFAFGLAMTGGLFLYWELYTRPFRQLQVAIARQYPGSGPRVVGGRHRSHEAGAIETLRVVVKIPDADFDPTQSLDASEQRALELARLVMQVQDLTGYETLEIHLTQRVPEQETRHWSVARPIEEWRKMGAGP